MSDERRSPWKRGLVALTANARICPVLTHTADPRIAPAPRSALAVPTGDDGWVRRALGEKAFSSDPRGCLWGSRIPQLLPLLLRAW